MAHQKYINAVKISPNDKLIATSSQDKTVKIWDAKTLTLLKTLSGHRRGIWDIQFSPADQLIASASGDNTLKVWSLSTGQSVATLQGHQAALVKLNWLNLGLQIATASVDGVVKIWNVKKQVCQNTFEMHDEKIWALDFCEHVLTHKDESYTSLKLITGSSDSKVKIWIDNTVEQAALDKQTQLDLINNEHNLSKLMRENDLV